MLVCYLAFDRTGKQPSHKIFLQCEEDDHWQDHGNEGSRSQQMPSASQRSNHIADLVGEHGMFPSQEDQGDQQVIPYTQELEY